MEHPVLPADNCLIFLYMKYEAQYNMSIEEKKNLQISIYALRWNKSLTDYVN